MIGLNYNNNQRCLINYDERNLVLKSITVQEIFIVMGLVIVVSFLATTFFRRTKIPNSIILILIGIGLTFWKNPIDLEILRAIAPTFGSFALLLILLEAGLDLDMRHFFKSIGPAIVFGTLSYVFGVALITWTLKSYFAYSMLNSFLLSLVSVGCSPSILMPILKGMNIEQNQKTFLDLECTVTEVLGLILTISFIPYLLPALNGTPWLFKSLLFSSSHKFLIIFVIAIFVPVILGMLWSRLLSFAGERPLWPILTIGIALLLYGATESLGGKGALNVLIFGLVVGNARIIRIFFIKMVSKLKWIGQKGEQFLSFFVGQNFAKVQHISRELSFFVRTFFFVYLGVIVDFSQFSKNIFLIVCALTFLPMFVRFLLAYFFIRMNIFQLPSTGLIVYLSPRGLANALIVFAIIDYAQQINLPSNVIASLQISLIAPVFGVVILSNLVLTFYLILRKETSHYGL